ncbi:PTS sugar transporter subunit IIA [Brevibacillus sp. H7]|uniref:PTS sugar transporter subunit IIA n=1 Tax=Brevibacillus sp. H7 TaxID=3349138 RepID=UPI003822EB4C
MLGNLFSRKKEQKDITLYAPVTGTTVALRNVPDPVFSQKIVGDGVAIQPSEGLVVAPIDSTVTHLFPTCHAIGLTSETGLEILIHIGIDTVKLNGRGFTPHVAVGDVVRTGDKLIEFDLSILQKAGYPAVTPVVITNGERVSSLIASLDSHVIAGREPIITIALREGHL